MTKLKLIEFFKQNLNFCEVIATVEENEKEFLGISQFYLNPGEVIPEDEDALTKVINDKSLVWDLYIPNYDDELTVDIND